MKAMVKKPKKAVKKDVLTPGDAKDMGSKKGAKPLPPWLIKKGK